MCVLVLAIPASGLAQEWEQPPRTQANLDALARVEVRTHVLAEAAGVDIPYGVYVPTSYDAARATPLVIALHGLGSDEMYMMEYNNLVELAEQYGYLIATPLGFNERGWYGSRGPGRSGIGRGTDPGPENLGELSELDVLAVLRIMQHDFHVDADRTYLIGQSMGGGGTWHIGMKYPEMWAAMVPMAPAIYSSPDALTPLRDRLPPIMVIHGDADTTVDVEISRRWVAALRELGMEHAYIEVPGGSHASAGRENIGRVFAFLSRHSR